MLLWVYKMAIDTKCCGAFEIMMFKEVQGEFHGSGGCGGNDSVS